MNEERIEDAFAAVLAAALAALGSPGLIWEENTTPEQVPAGVLPILRAGLYPGDLDREHVGIAAPTAENWPAERVGHSGTVNVALVSPREVGRNGHAARVRLLRRCLVRADLQEALQEAAEGLAVQHVVYRGRTRSQDGATLSSVLRFDVMSTLTS